MSFYFKTKPKHSHIPSAFSSTPPKLSLFSLPAKPQDPPGLITPPLQTPASVPFQWEEAPGKPRPAVLDATNTSTSVSTHKPKSVRSLDLPPRMLTPESCKATTTPSPSTVLDGPCDAERTLSSTWSFRRLAGRSEGGAGIKKIIMESCKVRRSPAEYGRSWRWGGGSAKVNKDEGDVVIESGSGLDTFDCCGEYSDADVEEIVKVKLMKVKRKGSFFNAKSPMWSRVQEGVYGSLKQIVVVPWRRSSGRSSKVDKRKS